jgi:hypothetical protein
MKELPCSGINPDAALWLEKSTLVLDQDHSSAFPGEAGRLESCAAAA